MEDLVVLRDYDSKTDDPYIYSTWTKFGYYSPKEPITIPKQLWFEQKIQAIREMLATGDVRVACLKYEPYVIIGYSVYFNNVLKKLCIKSRFRNQGVEYLLTKSKKRKEDEDGRTKSPTPKP